MAAPGAGPGASPLDPAALQCAEEARLADEQRAKEVQAARDPALLREVNTER
jgi:hypothetical protein